MTLSPDVNIAVYTRPYSTVTHSPAISSPTSFFKCSNKSSSSTVLQYKTKHSRGNKNKRRFSSPNTIGCDSQQQKDADTCTIIQQHPPTRSKLVGTTAGKLEGILCVHVKYTICGGSSSLFSKALSHLRHRIPFRKCQVGEGMVCGSKYVQNKKQQRDHDHTE